MPVFQVDCLRFRTVIEFYPLRQLAFVRDEHDFADSDIDIVCKLGGFVLNGIVGVSGCAAVGPAIAGGSIVAESGVGCFGPGIFVVSHPIRVGAPPHGAGIQIFFFIAGSWSEGAVEGPHFCAVGIRVLILKVIASNIDDSLMRGALISLATENE